MMGRGIRQRRIGPASVLRGWSTPIALVVLICCLLLEPAGAVAAEYTVNSIGDQVDEAPGSNGCKTTVDTCTLRAAIEESNASTGINDTIKFSSSFDGQIDDTIELGTSLPTITDRVRIQGFPSPQPCKTDYFDFEGPCVGVNGPAGGTAFRIAAERVILIGFAISGAQTAIEAVGAPGLETWNDWLGIKLDGSARSIETGISLDQGSNGADIGGASPVARNIFAHNASVAVDIDGASFVTVRGNGFGVLPDGNSLAANGTNIEITDAATGDNRVAQGNWIGGTLDDERLASSTCDGPCNLISGATESGIDLVGDDPDEEPSSGSTRIFGNYIGLNAFGTTGLPNALHGVLVGPADDVTIGGPRPGDRNLLNGGANGVFAWPNVGNLTVENNWIGLGPAGTSTLAPPSTAGIAVEGGSRVEITGNRISMPSGTAIQQGAQEAVVRSNAIGKGINGEDLPGATVGVHLLGSCFICNLVYGNSISNATAYGVLIENGKNHVYGNRIVASGEAGIRIQEHGFALDNEIGGDTAMEENTISKSLGAAIEIVRTEFGAVRRNRVARNHGAFNGGLFIDLVNGANEDIQPPTLSSSTQSGASGEDAVPGAVIRVFRKAGGSPGEIETFLAETVVEEGGDWVVTYPGSIPGGTMVAASQTTPEDGTSEFAFAATAAEPDGGGDGGDAMGGRGASEGVGPGGSVGPRTPDRDTTPPRTFILSGTNKKSRSRIVRFRFISSEPNSRFSCRLDRRPVKRCRSPKTYRGLRPGRHLFRVWATDRAGNRDRTSARYKFRVIREDTS
jgi:CSLREA domain-containing protein